MTPGEQPQAIVIGAGIGGLAAAIALRRAGWNVVVVERVAAVQPVGAALTLWANALHALDHLGLALAVRACGAPQHAGGLRAWDGRPLVSVPADALAARLGDDSLAATRGEIHTILRDALPAGVLHLHARCLRVTQDADSVTAHLEDGTTLHGAVAIGADGAHSTVREGLFGPLPARPAGYSAWHGLAPFAGVVPTGEAWGRGLRFGSASLTGGRVHWFAVVNDALAPRAVDHYKAALQSLFAAWHAPIPDVIAATDEAAILHTAIAHHPPLAHWTVGRVTLLGDAAHPMTPNLGQGACQALEDAVVLGQCLLPTANVYTALRRYERLRLPRTRRVAQLVGMYGVVAQCAGPIRCRLRDATLRAAPAPLHHRGLAGVVGPAV